MKVSFSHHRFQSKKLETFFCGVALLAAASGAHGAVLVDDNFTNSTGSSANMENTQAPGVGTYEKLQGNTDSLTVTTVSGFGNGNVLQIANNANTYFRAFNNNTTVNLAALAAGQTLSMSFDFRTSGPTGAENFGFGFLNATNSIAYVNLDARATSPVSEFRFRTGSPNMSGGSTPIGNTWNNVISPATNNNFEFTITKTGETSYLLRYLLNGTEISSATSALASTDDIDITGIGFRWGEAPGTATNIDNVVVELIPEPSSLLLLGGSLSCGLLLRRRQR